MFKLTTAPFLIWTLTTHGEQRQRNTKVTSRSHQGHRQKTGEMQLYWS